MRQQPSTASPLIVERGLTDALPRVAMTIIAEHPLAYL
jgi:hypothetical protein